ncbi:hypothetical protein [Sorangium sp. So ce426]|uniref:hypothetical protein n=1 Tax=unclassified Sorangium TaxID=2621164 RepID=UPI003F5B9D4E
MIQGAAGGTFLVVQASDAEKGPFTTLGEGRLARGEPLSVVLLPLVPLMKLVLPALKLEDVERAMVRCVTSGAPEQVLEVADIEALASA